MKHLPILLLFVGASIFVSCDKTSYDYDYKSKPVEFDKSELTISANKDSATFHASRPWYTIEVVSVEQDGKQTTIFPTYPNDTAFISNLNKNKMYQVDWLTFKRSDDKNTIEVVALPNTGTTRKAKISLIFTNDMGTVTLIQKGQK
jgi:hypothetical protein